MFLKVTQSAITHEPARLVEKFPLLLRHLNSSNPPLQDLYKATWRQLLYYTKNCIKIKYKQNNYKLFTD